jgi:hypothetical protein
LATPYFSTALRRILQRCANFFNSPERRRWTRDRSPKMSPAAFSARTAVDYLARPAPSSMSCAMPESRRWLLPEVMPQGSSEFVTLSPQRYTPSAW